MIFKQNWEKTHEHHQLPLDAVQAMVALAYPDKVLSSHLVISGGCANLNIKINFEGDEHPRILRVYLHDRTAAYREQKLGALLKQTVPVPQTYYVGDYKEYRFAITEYMPGITLRELLLGNAPHDVGSIMYEVGGLLAKLSSHTFPKAGFFDQDLTTERGFGDENIEEFALNCLKHPEVQKYLNAETRASIEHLLKTLPQLTNAAITLVHADFDPANILVEQRADKWRVTGILDWEFSYAGFWMDDVATMLRYSHKMPPVFEEAFIKGLEDQGRVLPENWQLLVSHYNIGALLDCMTRHPLHIRPNILEDIHALLHHIIQDLEAN